jgi:hypothetical protein
MGSGDIGSNGSVHFREVFDDAKPQEVNVYTLDPIDPNLIGTGSNGQKKHKGSFKVLLRFADFPSAEAALAEARRELEQQRDRVPVIVPVLVPAVANPHFETAETEPRNPEMRKRLSEWSVQRRQNVNSVPPWEIKIDW